MSTTEGYDRGVSTAEGYNRGVSCPLMKVITEVMCTKLDIHVLFQIIIIYYTKYY